MEVKTMKLKLLMLFLTGLSSAVLAGSSNAGQDRTGAVYAMTNSDTGNEVVVYDRHADGRLTQAQSYPTNGLGSGGVAVDPLGSQGSLILSSDRRWLIAVNAGSNEISVFRVRPNSLKLTDKAGSGGTFPSSLTLDQDLLYVLNAGSGTGSPNITGFRLSHGGELIPLAGSTRALGTGAYSQVGFDRQGQALVITQRDTNEIHVFSIDRHGLPGGAMPTTSASAGGAPFGFVFGRRERLLVSEAGSGSVSSYEILPDATLQAISPMVANGQTATCWIASDGNRFAYTSNTGSGTLSAYGLGNRSGSLVLLDAEAGTGNLPIDLAISGNNRYLYVLNAGDGTVGAFRISPKGSLIDLGAAGGLPSLYAQGIAAR
jgi:6-phosphogluconolactonase